MYKQPQFAQIPTAGYLLSEGPTCLLIKIAGQIAGYKKYISSRIIIPFCQSQLPLHL